MIAGLWVLVQIAFRNLFTSWINVVIGALILAGTTCTVVGSSMLDSVDEAMSKSIVGSVAGHVQIYSARSKDELALYGNMGGEADLAAIEDFSRIKRALEQVKGVKTVVPMGINAALVNSGNTVDLALEKLRGLYNQQKEAPAPAPELDRKIDSVKAHLRQMISVLRADMQKARQLVDEKAIDPESARALERAASDAFWASFDDDPFASLEFLENHIAPQVADADLLYVRYVGTDLDAFQRSFDRMQIVDGEMVPKGKRGFLFSKFFYEEELKLKTARRLDRIKEAIEQSGKKIATDPVLARWVKENQAQTKEIVLQLDGERTRELVARLEKALGSTETDLSRLLSELFATTDENFHERYRIFYEQVAPMLELYRVRVGDVLTIKAFTRTGYVQSINVKVYGTFNFMGLEKSPLAGGVNLMDLMSFRDLYGYLTADKKEELERLKAQSGAQDVSRDAAEAELFGEGRQIVAEATPGLIDESKELSGVARALRTEDLLKRVYSQEEIESGVVLNAALILDDPSQIDRVIADVDALSKAQGLELKAVSWQKASGMLGEFVFFLKAMLYFGVGVVFVVAMVVINNAMMMATLQRRQVIGTMRAIGAQSTFVLGMVFVETVMLGVGFGAIGALIGSGVMAWLNSTGIPAFSDEMYFFFSGPRLHPSMDLGNVAGSMLVVLLVSLVSTWIPAMLATSVPPVQAMQTEE